MKITSSMKAIDSYTAVDIFKMCKSQKIAKMTELPNGFYTLEDFICYEDTDNEGQPTSILSVKFAEEESVYATNSPTAIRTFIEDIFTDVFNGQIPKGTPIEKCTGISEKNKRTFLYFSL